MPLPPTIDGVSTATTAFIGRARRGPFHTPVAITSSQMFARTFGELARNDTLRLSIEQFFVNKGSRALVVRVPARVPIADPSLEPRRQGLWALDRTADVNLLCIPPSSFDSDLATDVRTAATRYCDARGALFLADPLRAWRTAADVLTGPSGIESATWGVGSARSVALYFPLLHVPQPGDATRLTTCVPCGAVAGIMARTDAQRGVWKAAAGLDAALHGVAALDVRVDDVASGELNRLGVNALRTFPGAGAVVWGARTLAGADTASSEWKYVPVRRTAVFVEHSIYRGTDWAVFEPNDEPLWARVRLAAGAFMNRLFRLGAFAGARPDHAYFVRCDRSTMTQADIDVGRLIVLVGFAPLRPAEFVVLRIEQRVSVRGPG